MYTRYRKLTRGSKAEAELVAWVAQRQPCPSQYRKKTREESRSLSREATRERRLFVASFLIVYDLARARETTMRFKRTPLKRLLRDLTG